MLSTVERVVAIVSWVIAAVLVVMLFVGPELIADDKEQSTTKQSAGASPYAGGSSQAAPDGKTLFTDRCGSCHTLSAAGTSGTTGPNLDDVSLDAGAIEGIVRDGRGGMPAFGGQLSDDEIAAVADFVASN